MLKDPGEIVVRLRVGTHCAVSPVALRVPRIRGVTETLLTNYLLKSYVIIKFYKNLLQFTYLGQFLMMKMFGKLVPKFVMF